MSDTTTDTITQAPVLAPMADSSGIIVVIAYILIAYVLIKYLKLIY